MNEKARHYLIGEQGPINPVHEILKDVLAEQRKTNRLLQQILDSQLKPGE